ncbi:hypothetical protein WQ57_17600 [Mesobacillus campisalis]|uniref:Lipoprotein n=1 Tax=Mesobacillus campisalis TaxID=1408103 RepID=A0A0M2SVV9_9BACI|nr:hypothetical protein [Mesobacillus campisalis]KKK36775.1 hypothetical protein WQ57_17600 [Mesobacillus campisalis]
MKKILLPIMSAVLLAACSGQENTDTANPEEASAPPEFETDGMTLKQLEETLHPGTDLDTYGMEVQALVQQGRINIQEKVQLSDDGKSHADIIAAKDGFLAVVNDGNQVTHTEKFDTADAARTYLDQEH